MTTETISITVDADAARSLAQAPADERRKLELLLSLRLMELLGGLSSGEEYTDERKAEFLLHNAVDEADYQSARAEVVKLGIDPDRIAHVRPGQRPAGA